MPDLYTPEPHQVRALERMQSQPGLAVFYSPGMGKTGIQALGMQRLVEQSGGRVLGLVPNAIIEDAQEEYANWLGKERVRDDYLFLHTIPVRQRLSLLRYDPQWKAAVVTHEDLSRPEIAAALRRIPFEGVLVDEASRFRNSSKRTTNLLGLKAGQRNIFTGTPIVRNPGDLWYPLKFIDPRWCGITRRELFNAEYCILGGWDGCTPIDIRPDRVAQLRSVLAPFCIYGTLSDVRQMPQRTVVSRRCSLFPEQLRLYNELRDTLRLEIERENEESYLLKLQSYVTRLMKLLEIAAGFTRNQDGEVVFLRSAKTAELLDLLQDRTPSIVWVYWRAEHELVERALREFGISYSTLDNRKAWLDGETDVLLASISKGGVGLNLDRAERVVYHSLCFNAELMAQSLDRNYRWTSTTDRSVVYLIARNTVDEHVRTNLQQKSNFSSKISRSAALELLA